MAHNWSSLLSDVQTRIGARAPLRNDREKEVRRPSTGGGANGLADEGRSSRGTAFASKVRIPVASSGNETIGDLLHSRQLSDDGIIALFSNLTSRTEGMDEEEFRRGGGGGSSGRSRLAADRSGAKGLSSVSASHPTASRAAVAAGAQPAVIKVTSTISTRASAAGLINYLGTREADGNAGSKGRIDIPIQDQDGHTILSGEQRAQLLREWAEGFRESYAVNSVVSYRLTLDGAVDDTRLHAALNSAFGAKPFVYRRDGNDVAVFGVTDLAARKLAGAIRARAKETGKTRAVEQAEKAFAASLSTNDVAAAVTIEGAAASETSARYFLEKFLRSHTGIVTSTGDRLSKPAAAKPAAEKIWEVWSAHIRTFEPRNGFHVIFSARAGTDAQAMTRAVRDFLSEQVPGHKWITAYHPDTGHVHVHAMISARDDVGKPLRFTKPELYAWREAFAAKAREHGIAMVATRRADFAANRPYNQAQGGAYKRGRADPNYLKQAVIQLRIENKRSGALDRQSLANGNLALAQKWRVSAKALQAAGASAEVIQAADRFAAAANRHVWDRRHAPRSSSQLQAVDSQDTRPADVPRAADRLEKAIEIMSERKGSDMALSLEQFDERVARANKSMDRLEGVVDSSAERQAVEEMRREVSALFAEQRRDIELQQMRTVADSSANTATNNTDRPGDGAEPSKPHKTEPAIAAQQQAIAQGRAERASKEQAANMKAAQEQQRQDAVRRLGQEGERQNGRDGAER